MTQPLSMPDGAVDAFAACAPGLEPLLAAELGELGVSESRVVPGGVEFAADQRMLYRVNLWSGIAIFVLIRVARFRAARLPELRRKAGNVEWGSWLRPGTPCVVRARSRKSKIYHSGAIEQRFAEALEEFGCSADEGAVGVHVRIDHNECTVSVDTSGEPLHRRGWRLQTAKAPLREDLAHALVRASTWDRESPLVDPMCGAGTIAIEAAALAAGLPPGRLRAFDFERLAPFDAEAWAAVRADVETPRDGVRVFGSDRDAGAIEAARANAERAGVDVQWTECALSDAAFLSGDPSAPECGAVVTNPPYGERIGNVAALRDLYAKFGSLAGALPSAWRTAFVTSDAQLADATRLGAGRAFHTEHGGLRISAYSTAYSPKAKSSRSGPKNRRRGRGRRE